MATTTREYITDGPRPIVAETPTTLVSGRVIRHISWGAVVAGAAIALLTMLALHMLGLAIGAATINPAIDPTPVEPGLGTAAMIWLAASNLISLFLGGYVAGRMSGIANDTDGAIHGLVTFSVVVLLGLTVVTTAIGNIANTVVSAAAQTVSTVGQAAAEVAPEVADALNIRDTTLQSIQADVSTMFRSANGSTAVQTNTTEANNTDTQTTTNTPTTTVPGLDELELNRAVSSFLMSASPTEEDRANLVTMLVERGGVTQQEAETMVARWETTMTELRTNAEEMARDAAQRAADTTTALAGVVFAALIVGAFAAGIGGMVGTPGGKI
ncbi:MAG: hypothetical protein U0694_10735 [Anaerolineae bacterium]